MRGGYVDTTNRIELTKKDVIEEIEVVERSAREKRKSSAKEFVMSSINESIENARNPPKFMEIQLS